VLPTWLLPPTIALAAWTAAAGSVDRNVLTEALPGALIVPLALADYVLWRRRGKPWHDWVVILLLMPAIACAVWIGVGGLLMGTDRTTDGRLLVEVGPGLALTGLLTTMISYHGRHHPDEQRARTRPAAPRGASPRG